MTYLKSLSIRKSILNLIKNNSLSYFFLFLTSIIIFRSVDREAYGLYAALISVQAFSELFMSGVNSTILRFMKEDIPLEEKYRILGSSILFKLFISGILTLVFWIFFEFNVFAEIISDIKLGHENLEYYLILIILNNFLGNFSSIAASFLNSQNLFILTAKFDLQRNIIFFGIVLVLSFITNDYLIYLYSSSVLSLIFFIVFLFLIRIELPDFWSIKSLNSFSLDIIKKYHIRYSGPLTLSSIMTYSKNHLPIIFIGKFFNLDDVAVYSVIKSFFKSFHSVTGSFFEPMLSKFVELKRNRVTFSKNFTKLFYWTFFIRLCLAFSLVTFAEFYFQIYEIEFSELNFYVFLFLSIEFVLASNVQCFNTILKLDSNTTKIFIVSAIRFVSELILIIVFLPLYGYLAASLILVLGRFIEFLFSHFFVGFKIVHLSYILIFIYPVFIITIMP